jgi:hypothetical protein
MELSEAPTGPAQGRRAESNETKTDEVWIKGDQDMSDASQEKSAGFLKSKPWIWLVAAFAILVVVGIATS